MPGPKKPNYLDMRQTKLLTGAQFEVEIARRLPEPPAKSHDNLRLMACDSSPAPSFSQSEVLTEEEMGDLRNRYPKNGQSCVWISDLLSGKLLFVDSNFIDIWGTTSEILKDDITGFIKSVFPSDKDQILATLYTNIEKGFTTKLRTVTANGELNSIKLHCDIVNEKMLGDRSLLIFTATDITEQHSLENFRINERHYHVQKARLADLTKLAAKAAHEIKTPLTALFKQLEQLRTQLQVVSPAMPSHKKHATTAANEAQLAAERIDRIQRGLEILSEQNLEVLELEVIPLHQIFTEVRELVMSQFRLSEVRLIFPTVPAKLDIKVHRVLMIQALMNLITNSIESIDGSKEPWIEIDFTYDHDSVFIYITDSGNGIPIKNRSHIFDPFFTTKEEKGHVGIGLSQAMNLMAKYMGTVALDSLHPRTRFVIQIPRFQHKT